MSEFIISSEQLERLIEGIEHNTGREITKVVCDGTELDEIVRCRDCKFAIINPLGDCKYCERFWDTDGDAQLNLPGDFFCAWGERRDA